MAVMPSQPPARMSWPLRIVFALSLAFNLLVIGMVAGTIIRFGVPPSNLSQVSSVGMALYRELPREYRRAFRGELTGRIDRTVLRQTRIGPEMDRILRADEFDPVAVRAMMNRQVTAFEVGQAAIRESWIQTVGSMSPAERSAYADRLRAALRDARSRVPIPPGF